MATSKLKIDIRRNRILQQLRAEGMVSVAALAKELDATPVTIRTDLSALEQDGYLIRVQGGAVLPAKAETGCCDASVTDPEILSAKRTIAQAISNMVSNGQTLFINSGTTTACVAEALRSKMDLNVVTKSLAVATALGSTPSIRVILLGGEINAQYGFTYGGDTQEQLCRYKADMVILSCEGISAGSGITTRHAEEAMVDRLMIAGAKSVLLAADHRKIGHAGFARVCNCDKNFAVVTDGKADPEALQELLDQDIRIQTV